MSAKGSLAASKLAPSDKQKLSICWDALRIAAGPCLAPLRNELVPSKGTPTIMKSLLVGSREDPKKVFRTGVTPGIALFLGKTCSSQFQLSPYSIWVFAFSVQYPGYSVIEGSLSLSS